MQTKAFIPITHQGLHKKDPEDEVASYTYTSTEVLQFQQTLNVTRYSLLKTKDFNCRCECLFTDFTALLHTHYSHIENKTD